LAKAKTKVLTSAKAKEDGSVDPKAQISANEYEEAKKQHKISKRVNTSKVRHPELVLYVLGSLPGSC
jgi:hypothetical protein